MGTLYGEGTDKTALEGGLAETHANRMARLGEFLSQFKKRGKEGQTTGYKPLLPFNAKANQLQALNQYNENINEGANLTLEDINSRQPTVWEVMSDEELMNKFGTTDLDPYGVPKASGYYDSEGYRIDGKSLERYDEPNVSFLKNIYNKLMPFDSLDFENVYRQPATGREGYIFNGRSTNYPYYRTYDDGFGMF